MTIKKILHIGKYYPPFMGGIENFMQLLLPQFDQNKYHVKAIVHHHQPFTSVTKEWIDGIEVYRIPSYGRLLFAPISPSFPYYLNQMIQSFKPDILHIHMPNTSAFWLLLSSKAKKIPWVIHWHSDVLVSQHDRLLAMAYPFYRPFETALLKKSQSIIVTSPDYLKSSISLKHYSKKCHVIPLALKNKLKQLSKKEHKQRYWGSQKNKILSIGRLTYYKGHEDLIKSMQFTQRDSQLIIVGEGEQRHYLEKLIKKLNLFERVQLVGKVDNSTLEYLLSSCDIFCLSSIERTEAFGLVLLEAMSHTKPIVVTKVEGSGMNWVCQNNKNALFTEKQNPEDIANKVNQLISDPHLAHSLAENGYKCLQKKFNLDTITKLTEQLYQEI